MVVAGFTDQKPKIEESKNTTGLRKPNLRIHTQIDENFQIHSAENTVCENSTDGVLCSLGNEHVNIEVSSKEINNGQVLIEDQLYRLEGGHEYSDKTDSPS